MQAKDLGNYHPTVKHIFEDESGKKRDRRKRERGLKLGVGRFSGGVLKLKKNEVASLQGSARFTGGRRGGKKRS